MEKGALLKNILVVASGSAIAQGIGFALSPVVSRLYSPADFGILGAFNSVANMIGGAATLEYNQALMLPKKEQDAINLFALACTCVGCVAALIGLVCMILPGPLNGLMKTEGAWGLILLVVVLVASGLGTSFQSLCVRIKAFKATSSGQVSRTLTSNLLQICLGTAGLGAPALVASTVVAEVAFGVVVGTAAIRKVKESLGNTTWRDMFHLAAEYKDFPIYNASMGYINVVSLNLPVLLLAHYYGLSVAGAYSFGMKIVQAPASLIAGALRQVLFQRICEVQNQGGKLMRLYLRSTLGLLAMAMVPSLTIVFFGADFFGVLFGETWRGAGELSRYLVLWLALMFGSLPAVLCARAMRLQRKLFLLDVALLAMRAGSLVLGGVLFSAGVTVLLFSLVGALVNAVMIGLVAVAIARREGLTCRQCWRIAVEDVERVVAWWRARKGL